MPGARNYELKGSPVGLERGRCQFCHPKQLMQYGACSVLIQSAVMWDELTNSVEVKSNGSMAAGSKYADEHQEAAIRASWARSDRFESIV